MTVIGVIVALIVAVAAAAAGYFIGYNNRKKTAEAQIGSAEAEATRLVNEAIKTADQKRKEAILEAKDEAFRRKASSLASRTASFRFWSAVLIASFTRRVASASALPICASAVFLRLL